ncbi:MAG TPA: hypothetical protein VIM16_18470 [Mucilaginibacter sp.]|jgi:hypothetical protein
MTLAILVVAAFCYRPFEEVINYYNIPSSLIFNNIHYELSWSAHPNSTYYKQEYVSKGEQLQHFNDMLLIDFSNSDIPVEDVVQAQIIKLVERKKTDIVCNYQLLKNEKTNEFMLDFIMSEGSNNRVTTVEWNAYHYKPHRCRKRPRLWSAFR